MREYPDRLNQVSSNGSRQMALMVLVIQVVTCFFYSVYGQWSGDARRDEPVRVVVDPRVELISTIYRLAGSPEYNQRDLLKYVSAVEAQFERFKTHAVVQSAIQLRKQSGISFNAPMSLAVHISDPPELAPRVPFSPFPPNLDQRWSYKSARSFLQQAPPSVA